MNSFDWQRKLTILCGLLGVVIVITGCVVTALPFHGEQGENYSVLNHFISELGIVGVSKLAAVFNGSLTCAGLVIAVFMAGLGRHLQTALAQTASVAGVASGALCSVVGRIPMNDLVPHLWAAFAFFSCGLLTVGLFCVEIARDKEERLPRWLAVAGLLAFVSFAAFLAYPLVTRQTPFEIVRISRTARPDIWAVAILEWLVLITVTAWIILVSACLWLQKTATVISGRQERPSST
ncbi:MAG: DUF998 domain-containing protein [Verrucomicrobia bacterium]|nr:DUF998 domain-containing protein [Verrucomicrobiota bacterium]